MGEKQSLLLNICDRIKPISLDPSRQLIFSDKNIPGVERVFAPPLLSKETRLLRYTWPVKLGAIHLFLEGASVWIFCGCFNLFE